MDWVQIVVGRHGLKKLSRMGFLGGLVLCNFVFFFKIFGLTSCMCFGFVGMDLAMVVLLDFRWWWWLLCCGCVFFFFFSDSLSLI